MKFTKFVFTSLLSVASLSLSSCYTSNDVVSSSNKTKSISTESINFNPSRSLDNLIHSINSESFISGDDTDLEEKPQFTYETDALVSSQLLSFGPAGMRMTASYKFTFNNGHSDLIVDSDVVSGRLVVIDDNSDGILDFISLDGGKSGAVTMSRNGANLSYSGPISSDSHAKQLYVDILTTYVHFLSDNNIKQKIEQFYKNK